MVRDEFEGMSAEEREFLQKMMKLDVVTRGCLSALTQREPHVENGALWAAVRTEEIKADAEIEQAVKTESAVQYWGIPTGLLVSVNPSIFFGGMAKVDAELAEHYKVEYEKGRENAITNLQKRLTRFFKRDLAEGKNVLRVGIFSVNASPKATAQDGEKIDAFQLDFAGFSTILQAIATEFRCQAIIHVTPKIYFPAGQYLSPRSNIEGASMCRENRALEVRVSVSQVK